MGMKDNSLPANAQFPELILLASRCSEESINISVTTSPDVTPTSTPSSTPPARRKRWQRQSGTRSPNKEKSNTIALPVGGGASAAGKSKPLFVSEEKEQLVMISVPLTSDWNTEVVYTVEQESERKVSYSFAIEDSVLLVPLLCVVFEEFRGSETH